MRPAVAVKFMILRYVALQSSPIPIRTSAQTSLARSDGPAVPTEHEIEQLMDQVVKTDAAAEAELKQLLRPGVEFFLRRSIAPRKPVDGPVEEALFLIVLGIQSHAVKSAPALLTFAVRIAKSYRQSSSRTTVTMEGRRNAVAMSAVLDQIPPIQRQAFLARYAENKSAEEIAVEFGISPNELKELCSAIRSRYQERIAKGPGSAGASQPRLSLVVA